MEDLESSVRTAPGSDPARVGSTGVISPELALVDPDTAAAARAALPDRPWDIALDRARAERNAPTPPSAGGEVAPREWAAPDVAIQPVRPRRRRVGAAAARRLVFMVVWAVMVTGIALLAEVRRPTVPALGAGEASAPTRQAGLPTPVPGAGYVIGARSGFRVGPQGRAIGSFTVPVECLWGVPLGRVAVRTDKTFSFRGIARGTGGRRVRIWLAGRFTGPRRAVGSVTVRGPGCVRRPVAFVARLS